MGCVASQKDDANQESIYNTEKEDPRKESQEEVLDSSNFRAQKILGKGGYGTVYQVQHMDSGRLFALKTLDKRFILARKFRLQQAVAERVIMSEMKSPYLLPLYCSFQDEDDLFLIMPVMEGGDLSNFVQTVGLMSEKMCQFYAAEVLMALKELNANDIIFRDLKPSNVLMDRFGHVKLSDYGLAVDLKINEKHDLAGTAGYMAPEVLLKHPLGVSVDVWTYGVTIYKLLTGHRPFKSTRSIMQDAIPFRSKIAANLSPVTKDLLKQLLRKNPEKRLGSGERGWEEVQAHPFFEGINWDCLWQEDAPYVPDLDKWKQAIIDSTEEEISFELTDEDQLLFAEWDYNNVMQPCNQFMWDARVPEPGKRDYSPVPTGRPQSQQQGRYSSVEPPRLYGGITLPGTNGPSVTPNHGQSLNGSVTQDNNISVTSKQSRASGTMEGGASKVRVDSINPDIVDSQAGSQGSTRRMAAQDCNSLSPVLTNKKLKPTNNPNGQLINERLDFLYSQDKTITRALQEQKQAEQAKQQQVEAQQQQEVQPIDEDEDAKPNEQNEWDDETEGGLPNGDSMGPNDDQQSTQDRLLYLSRVENSNPEPVKKPQSTRAAYVRPLVMTGRVKKP